MAGIYSVRDGIIGVQSAMGGRGGGFRYPLRGGLLFWLDADNITTLFQDSAATTPVTTDGQEVGAWVDGVTKTAKGTQGTATKLPLYKTNVRGGKSGILFDGLNDFISLPAFAIDGAVTVLAVLTIVDNDAVGDPFTFAINTGNTYFLWCDVTTSGSGEVTVTVYDTAARGVSAGGDPSGPLIVGISNAEGSPVSLWRNGVETVGVVNTGTFGSGSGGNKLGSWKDGATNPFSGYVHEFLVYDRVLSNAEMRQMSKYLGAKWYIPTVLPAQGNPLGIANAALWLDASALPGIDSEPVLVLADMTGNGYDAVQNTRSKQGLYVASGQGGRPSIQMDGANTFYKPLIQTIEAATGASAFGVFVIEDHSPANPPMLCAITNNGSEQFVLEMFYSVPAVDDHFFVAGYDVTDASFDAFIETSPIGAHLFGLVEAEGGNIVAYMDDASVVGDAISTFGCPYPSTKVVIGANYDEISRWMNGLLCEFIVWTRDLTADEVAAVKTYLINKWGIV